MIGLRMDIRFAASESTGLTLRATVIRENTWWVQWAGDLAELSPTTGPRHDLTVVATHGGSSVAGSISAYQTAASRDGSICQANFAASDSTAFDAWCQRVASTGSGTLSYAFTSASIGTPPSTPFYLGDVEVVAVLVGETEIDRAYLGESLVFGQPPAS